MLIIYKKYKKSIQLSISIFLLFYLFTNFINFSDLYKEMRGVNFFYVLLAWIFGQLGIIFSVARWKIVLKYLGSNTRFLKLINIYFVGLFYSLFLPGSISGDLVRAHQIRKNNSFGSVLSVPTERLLGLIALVIILILDVVFFNRYFTEFFTQLIILTVALLFVLSIMFNGCVLNFFLRFLLKIKVFSNLLKSNFILSVRKIQLIKNTKYFYFGIVLSFCFLLSSFLTTYLFAKAVNINIPYIYIMGVFPVIRIATMIPVSISGIGVKESLLVFFLGLINISTESAIIISLLGYLLRLINGGIGGIINFFNYCYRKN